MITVIYSIRDREPARLKNSVISLRNITKDKNVSFLVVDYGSSETYRKEISLICEELNIDYIRAETGGLPWSRAHALNIGVANAKTEFIALTDIDMIFEKDILGECTNKWKEDSLIHCQSLLLPKSGIKTLGKWGDRSQLGGFLFIKKDDFAKVGGFDEGIKFWGHEDFDLEQRFHANGFETIWLEKGYLCHKWHPLSNTFLSDRPESSWYDTLNISLKNAVYPSIDRSFGENILDRPILKFLNNSKPYIVNIKKYELEIHDLIEISKKKKFIRLIFPGRLLKRNKLSSLFDTIFLLLNKAILSRLGYKISVEKNNNFDLFYMSLPLLKENGLIDYYLYDGYEKVDILFK